jgi:small GTP-binding protein
MTSDPTKERYKVLVVGMTNTGKTSIIRQYIDGVFGCGNFPTVLPLADTIAFNDARGSYEMAIWDTAGADEWVSMNAIAFRSPDAIVFVASYDLAQSLQETVTKWLPLLRQHAATEDCIRVLAMNKIDIADAGEDEVAEREIEQTKQALDASPFLVSAKENRNIKEMFEFIGGEIRSKKTGQLSTIVEASHGHCCC